jgi:3-hydroxybutyryl-CoA dehydrogenase
MKNISVIGAGTMGNGIAHVFAQNGFSVSLIDLKQESLDKGLATITKNLSRMLEKGSIDAATQEATIKNISTFTSIKEGVAQADLVVEAASENVDIKLNIFRELDQVTPAHCILASNTSSISITKIAAATQRPDKVIGMHFMNPVPIMKLVEIINGYSTSKEVTHTIVEMSKTLGKIPVACNDYPGFVSNRILMPMINEAICSLHEGVAGVSEIDSIMRLGMAHPMGPLQLADFIGLDICHSILEVLYKGFGNPKYAPSALLTNMVLAGKLGIKSGEGFYDYSEGPKNAKVSKNFI